MSEWVLVIPTSIMIICLYMMRDRRFSLLEGLKNDLKHNLICKTRNYHTPNPKDVNEFLLNEMIPKETLCIVCKSELGLEQDDENKEEYWVLNYDVE